MSTLCPHCGRPDAPVEDGRIDRHRRADHRSGVDLDQRADQRAKGCQPTEGSNR